MAEDEILVLRQELADAEELRTSDAASCVAHAHALERSRAETKQARTALDSLAGELAVEKARQVCGLV